jgi:hypothetical protein
MNRAKISYVVSHFSSSSLSLFSSFAAAGISAEVMLFCPDKSETLIFETIANNIRSINPNNKSDIIYLAAETLEEALRGSSIVLSECFAEGELIRRYCPDAWCIYRGDEPSEPMKRMKSGFAGIKLILSDDQTDSVRDLLYDVVREKMKIEKPRRKDLTYKLSGIPYLCFLSDISYDGKPLTADILSFAEKYPDDYRLSFFSKYKILPAVSNEADDEESVEDFKKLVQSLRYGESVLPVGNFTETTLIIKSLLGGGNLISDAGVMIDSDVCMTGVLVQKNTVRRLS